MLIFEDDGHEDMPFQWSWSVSISSHCSLFVQVCLCTQGTGIQSCKQRFLHIHNTKCKVRLSGFHFLYKSHPVCMCVCIHTYTVCLLSFRTGIIKSICVKEMTLLLFSFRHTSFLTVHTDLHGHTASGCLCRSRPLQ